MKTDRSAIFSVYNKARKVSKTNPVVEAKRLNRALGLALSGAPDHHRYNTTEHSCDCPDFQKHSRSNQPAVCKHILARWLIVRATQLQVQAQL